MNTQALIVVDIQNEYFPQGNLSLVGINEAADNAALVIASAREKGHTVIHIRHEMPADAPLFTPGSDGVEINEKVKPIENDEPPRLYRRVIYLSQAAMPDRVKLS